MTAFLTARTKLLAGINPTNANRENALSNRPAATVLDDLIDFAHQPDGCGYRCDHLRVLFQFAQGERDGQHSWQLQPPHATTRKQKQGTGLSTLPISSTPDQSLPDLAYFFWPFYENIDDGDANYTANQRHAPNQARTQFSKDYLLQLVPLLSVMTRLALF